MECYHPSGAAGAGYMPSSSGGAQPSAQASLRVQPTPQPSAPPAPQQDMSKTTMVNNCYPFTNYLDPDGPEFVILVHHNQQRCYKQEIYCQRCSLIHLTDDPLTVECIDCHRLCRIQMCAYTTLYGDQLA